jgi:hypothetical protein
MRARLSLALLCSCALALAACRNYVGPQSLPDMELALPSVSWTQGMGTPLNEARAGLPVVLTGATDTLVGFGGTPTSLAATFAYDMRTNAWTTLSPSAAPTAGRTGHCAAFLPAQSAMLFVGGEDDDGVAQTTPLLLTLVPTPSYATLAGTAPTPTSGCAAAYFPRTQAAVIFGGAIGLDVNCDTWSFDPVAKTFTQLMPSGLVPPARSGAALVADPGSTGDAASSSLLLFDGIGPDGELDDLWRWDGTSWGEVPTVSDPNAMSTDEPRPVARTNAAVALDAARRILYVFGGVRESVELNDLWRLDLHTFQWQHLILDGVPTAREQASTAYDPVGDRMLLFGGIGQASGTTINLLADGWTLSVSH